MKLVAVAMLALTAACASAPPARVAPAPALASVPAAAPALDPVGKYEFSTSQHGNPFTGTFEITGTPGAYHGSIASNEIPEPLPISAVSVSGGEMAVTADTPQGPLVLHLTFAADGTFTGKWTLDGDEAALSGKRAS